MRQIITLEKEIAFKTMVGEITSISLEPDLNFINDSEIEGNLVVSGTYKMTEASALEEEFSYKIPVEIMLTASLDEEKRKLDVNNFTYQIVNEEALEIKVELLIEGLEKIEVEVIEEDKEEELVRSDDTNEAEVLKMEESNNDNIEVLEVDEIKEDVTSIDKKEELVREDSNDDIEVLGTDEKQEETLPSFNDVNTNIIEKKEKVSQNINNENTNNKQVMDSIFSAFANTEETYATYSVYILRDDDNLEEVMTKYNTNREKLAEYNDLDNLKIGTKLIIPTTISEVNE